ncbi:MAG: hypothetical protein D6754_06795 [Alphaproteobacteria bacterium]|nr:MAG: hypothetical protein D6754_06795 [Alphaproteobacteria bacterium]
MSDRNIASDDSRADNRNGGALGAAEYLVRHEDLVPAAAEAPESGAVLPSGQTQDLTAAPAAEPSDAHAMPDAPEAEIGTAEEGAALGATEAQGARAGGGTIGAARPVALETSVAIHVAEAAFAPAAAPDRIEIAFRNEAAVAAAISADPLDRIAHGKSGEALGPVMAKTTYFTPTDPNFADQWHLNNTGQSGGVAGVDINVTGVWDDYTGKGVIVGVYDDGVEYDHHDLNDNYDTSLHVTLGGVVHDPYPQSVNSRHGTSVAGVIAAEADGTGTVGVAFGATLYGVDIFYDPLVNPFDAMGTLDHADVTNHSWGWTTPFADNITDPAWSTFFNNIIASTGTGRGGLGTINLVAAGNDRTITRDVNDSNFNNIPQTIAVAAVNHNGNVSDYSTPGAALLISAPSNDRVVGGGIWTTDRVGANGYSDGTNEPGNPSADYTSLFGGTSSATPTTTGVVALMLEANPGLGWRDVQNILAMSARHVGSAVGTGPVGNELYSWGFNKAQNWNGGGMHFSNDYGYGLVDAHNAVRLAETWQDLQTDTNWFTSIEATATPGLFVPDNNPVGVSYSFTATSDVDLETVGLVVEITGGWTGDYYITLTSPDGTTSILSRDHNSGDSVNDKFFYTSNEFRGEHSAGTWTVHVSDRWAGITGTVTASQLEFYGGIKDTDDIYVFTDEFSDYAGSFGHATTVVDTNGGMDILNASAVTSDTTIDLRGGGSGTIDGVSVTAISGIETVFTGDGRDVVSGTSGAQTIDGGRGRDLLKGFGGNDELRGGDGNDRLIGQGGRDDLYGGANADNLKGKGGNDSIDGGGGNDKAFGGAGSDTIDTGAGKDTADGGSGSDVIHTGRGNDYIVDGAGFDDMYGGLGFDLFDVGVDGQKDEIFDFENDIDTIRLLGFSLATINITNTGTPGRVKIAYGGDKLFVEDNGAGLLTAADLTDDLIFV